MTAPKPSAASRGYGYTHTLARKRWARVVEAGDAYCARCGKWISPDAKWDLDHDDTDRTKYLGPSHQKCNRGAAARPRPAAANTVTRHSRIW